MHHIDVFEMPEEEAAPDNVRIRGLKDGDLQELIRIDELVMQRRREEFYRGYVDGLDSGKASQTSLVAEIEGEVVGFVLANLHYGEFGRLEPVAVLNSIVVESKARGRHVARALLNQLMSDLRLLKVKRLETQVGWEQMAMMSFLAGQGFKPAQRFCLEISL